jgi:hypothetical protein
MDYDEQGVPLLPGPPDRQQKQLQKRSKLLTVCPFILGEAAGVKVEAEMLFQHCSASCSLVTRSSSTVSERQQQPIWSHKMLTSAER